MKTIRNFKTKLQLLRAIARNELIEVYEPGPFPNRKDGEIIIEFNNPFGVIKVMIKDGFIKNEVFNVKVPKDIKETT